MVIHKHTVSQLLWYALDKLMRLDYLSDFQLVGGTSLSLLIGHKRSDDLDLFTDSEYGRIDFLNILKRLKLDFPCVEYNQWVNESMGNSCFIGNSK